MLGDCAYGAGETRAEFAAAGRTLIAKVPDLQNQGYFAKTDFQLDLEAGTCTCPNQHQTREFRPAKAGGGTFVFATEICAACPLRAQCTRGQGGRTVQVHPQEALLQQARELQKSSAFAEVRRRRQVVEHRIARLVQLGMRQARSVGRTKTLFQVCLAAAVANLTLLAATSTPWSTPGWQRCRLVTHASGGYADPQQPALSLRTRSSDDSPSRSPRPRYPTHAPRRLTSTTPSSAALLGFQPVEHRCFLRQTHWVYVMGADVTWHPSGVASSGGARWHADAHCSGARRTNARRITPWLRVSG